MTRFALKPVLSFLIASVIFVLTGCSGYQYVASPRYIPTNEKKGELTANVFPSSAQVGYSFTNYFSFFATAHRRFPTLGTVQPLATKKNHRWGNAEELTGGATLFGKQGHLLYELIVGYGVGKMTFGNRFEQDKNSNAYYEFEMKANKKTFFFQPNLSYKISKPRVGDHLVAGVFAKVNFVEFHDIVSTGSFGPESSPDEGIEFFRNRPEADLLFIEPGVFAKGGFKKFKGTVQVSPVINASGHSLRYNKLSWSVGLTMKLDLLKKEK